MPPQALAMGSQTIKRPVRDHSAHRDNRRGLGSRAWGQMEHQQIAQGQRLGRPPFMAAAFERPSSRPSRGSGTKITPSTGDVPS